MNSRLASRPSILAGLLLFAACLIFVSPAVASLLDAQEALAAGRLDQAQVEIDAIRNNPGVDPIAVQFSEGLLCIARKDYSCSIKAFRAILVDHPEFARVRLELARSFFLAGDHDLARLHFERVLGGKLPVNVVTNVNRYLAAIRRADRPWSFNFSIGYLSDTNMNQGTTVETVDFLGLPFQVDDQARRKSGVGITAAANGAYRLKLSEHWGLKAIGSVWRKDYQNSRYDDMVLLAGIGPSWVNQKTSVLIAPIVSYRTYGNSLYTRGYGTLIQADRQFGERLVAGMSFQRLNTQNVISRLFDERQTDGRIYGRYALSSNTVLFASAEAGRLRSDVTYFSYRSRGVSAGITRDWTRGLTTTIQVSEQWLNYDGIQPFFNIKRRDRLESLSVSIGKRDWAVMGFMPVLSLTTMRNQSTADYFEYSRNLLELKFDRTF